MLNKTKLLSTIRSLILRVFTKDRNSGKCKVRISMKKMVPFVLTLLLSTATSINFPLFSAESPEASPGKFLHMHHGAISKSFHHAETQVNRMKQFENQLSSIYKSGDDHFAGYQLESKPDNETIRQAKGAYIASKATQHLMAFHCPYGLIKSGECMTHLSKYNFKSSPLKDLCEGQIVECSKNDYESKYRTIDGSCNNEKDGSLGMAYTSYKRIIPADYLDGISTPRRSVTKKVLPSARLVSTSVRREFEDVKEDLTMAFAEWTEFISNDLLHTPSSVTVHTNDRIKCCDSDNRWELAPRHTHTFCLPIKIPEDDPFYKQHMVNCMSYVRSSLALRPGCNLGPNEQINQATHFLDGSQIYGSTIEKSLYTRKFEGGLIKTNTSADSRSNSHPHLSLMHTLFLREHNRIANVLAEFNPSWDDEQLYQEARRITIAEIQHITYDEWLPHLIGKRNSWLLAENEYEGDGVDPRISNSFATAAFRFVKSMVENDINLYSEDRNIISQLQLRDNYNNPSILENQTSFDQLVRGLSMQRSQKLDLHYASDVIEHFYGNGEYGLDSLSMDIQRGRDHGLPSYTKYTPGCGNIEVKTFKDFLKVMPKTAVEALSQVYADPNDVDLIVGGMAETPIAGSLLGPTFTCIINNQMWRTKNGDRYFYNNGKQPVAFTPEQRQEIQKVSLAAIFCENGSDVRLMQPHVFKPVSSRNNLMDCSKIPKINLKLWGNYFTYNL